MPGSGEHGDANARVSGDLRTSLHLRRQLVNFGVVSVARVMQVSENEPLELRCECGGADCATRLVVRRREYEAQDGSSHLFVAHAHADRNGQVVVKNARFAVVHPPAAGRPRSAGAPRRADVLIAAQRRSPRLPCEHGVCRFRVEPSSSPSWRARLRRKTTSGYVPARGRRGFRSRNVPGMLAARTLGRLASRCDPASTASPLIAEARVRGRRCETGACSLGQNR